MEHSPPPEPLPPATVELRCMMFERIRLLAMSGNPGQRMARYENELVEEANIPRFIRDKLPRNDLPATFAVRALWFAQSLLPDRPPQVISHIQRTNIHSDFVHATTWNVTHTITQREQRFHATRKVNGFNFILPPPPRADRLGSYDVTGPLEVDSSTIHNAAEQSGPWPDHLVVPEVTQFIALLDHLQRRNDDA